MSVATQKRTCRTCPSVISEHGGTGQCRPCQQRSEAVRAATQIEEPPPHPAVKPRARSCVTDGHQACAHFTALLESATRQLADCDFCQVCGSESVVDGEIVHQIGCALGVLINAQKEPDHV